jgi:hypothetical protein
MRSEHTVKNHHKKLLREILKIKIEDSYKQEANDQKLLEELVKRQKSRDPKDLELWEKSELPG